MHKNGTYKTIKFVYLGLCLVAFHPIGILLHTSHCDLHIYFPYCWCPRGRT